RVAFLEGGALGEEAGIGDAAKSWVKQAHHRLWDVRGVVAASASERHSGEVTTGVGVIFPLRRIVDRVALQPDPGFGSEGDVGFDVLREVGTVLTRVDVIDVGVNAAG